MFCDVNLSCGNWPFRRFARAEKPSEFFAGLAAAGIRCGIVRSCRAPWALDQAEVNKELSEFLKNQEHFIPAFSVRPDYSNWKTLPLKAAALFPSFHRYRLDSPESLEMGAFLAQKGAVALIVLREEDERNQNPAAAVSPVPVAEINNFAGALPELKIIVLNASSGEIPQLKGENIYADIAYAESISSLKTLTENFPAEKVLFGSHFPFFPMQAAENKIAFSRAGENVDGMVSTGNFRKLFSC